MKIVKWVLGIASIGFLLMIFIGLTLSNPSANALYAAKDAVAAQLREPSSATFRDINVYKLNDGQLLVCGEVNGRNGFGGMAQFQKFFMFEGKQAILMGTDVPETADEVWNAMGCDGAKGAVINHRD